MRKHILFDSALALALTATSCANMASGPSGGDKDVTPPKYIGSTPVPNQKNYNGKSVTVAFDEYIQLKDAYNQVMVSPPQNKPFSITSLGKKVTVDLQDSLKPNTTYVIDFANAIADNNEGNELKDYSICFSTGNEVDSFAISGTLLNADDLSPVSGAYVGAYEEQDDLTFRSKEMEHIGKTDKTGHFIVRGLAQKPYRIYALKDNNSDYKFDDKSEAIAVYKDAITPSRIEKIKMDTVYKDSTTIQAINKIKTSRFVPDSLLLRFYKETQHRQYYKNFKRDDRGKFSLYFVNERPQLPKITPLNFSANDWYIAEPSTTTDTITYWIKDEKVADMDTLAMAISYTKTDSTEQFVTAIDTLTMLPHKWKKQKKGKEEQPDLTLTKIVEVNSQPLLTWNTPLSDINRQGIHIEQKGEKDTSWKSLSYDMAAVANQPRQYQLAMKMEENVNYRITIDSGAVKDIYGIINSEKISRTFRLRKADEYVSLTLTVTNANGNAYLELLNDKDQTIRHMPMNSHKVIFANLLPGDYYVRLIEDANNDGEWTTGDFDTHREPENVYYYPSKFSLRANWDREEDWNIHSTKIEKQRPTELKSAKHQDKQK